MERLRPLRDLLKLASNEQMGLQDFSPPTLTEERLIREGEALEASEKTLGIWQSLLLHKRAVGYCLAAYACACVYGYDTIANSATIALPSFVMYFGSYDPSTKTHYLPSLWTSLWASMTGVGQILGSCIAGPVSQLIGRRYTGIGFASVTVLGVALQYIASSGGLLLAGKMINGLAVGGFLAVGTTYASEIAPTRLRGILLGGIAFAIVSMQCLGLGILRAFVPETTPQGFRTPFALQWIIGFLPAVAFLIVPESPNWLLQKGRIEAASSSLSRIYGKHNFIPARLAYLQRNLSQESKQDQAATYLDCFRGTDLKRTLTVCLLMLGNGLIGTAFLTQNIYFLGLVGLPTASAFDINIGGFALALIFMPLTWYYGDRVGRRSLYLVGVVGNVVGLGIVGALGLAPSSDRAALWSIAIILNLLITWQQFTNTLVSWSMCPELSSYRLRQLTQSITVMMQALSSWLFAFVTPYIYNVGKGSGNLGAKTGFVFMGSSLVLFVVAWFWIPEIQGLTTEEIDGLYERGVSPRRFKEEGRKAGGGLELGGIGGVEDRKEVGS